MIESSRSGAGQGSLPKGGAGSPLLSELCEDVLVSWEAGRLSSLCRKGFGIGCGGRFNHDQANDFEGGQIAKEYFQKLEGIFSKTGNIRFEFVWEYARGLYYKALFLHKEDSAALPIALSSFQRLIHSPNVRQELRIAAFCHYLQLRLIVGTKTLEMSSGTSFSR